MNIAICDDIVECREKLMTLLIPYIEKYSLHIEVFETGEAFISSLERGINYAIIFLDIELKGMSGLEVAQRIREKQDNTIIIFVTGYVNYVSDTFRLGAFQFLTKPINENDFAYDFERAIHTYQTQHRRYVVRWRDTNTSVEYNKIYYIEAYNRHLFIHTTSGEYECVGKLSDEYAKLKPYGFARCHQGYLVNLSKIKQIDKKTVCMVNEENVPISRQLRSAFLEQFNLYLAGVRI